jgi:transposase
LLYYDEAGFSASPPVQRAWSPVGWPHPVTPAPHQRVSVLGALDFAGQRLYHQPVPGTVNRETFVAFIDDLLTQTHQPLLTFIVLDNARIHHGLEEDVIWRWMTQHRAILCYLPPYSPELNRIEILWKQAKYHWREFVTWTKDTLLENVRQLLDGYGTKFQINFT